MVQVHRQSGPMVQVMVCLMATGSIRGLAEVLALAEVSVGVEAGAAVEVDLVIGNR